MKSIFIFLIISVVLISCEQNEFRDNMLKSNSKVEGQRLKVTFTKNEQSYSFEGSIDLSKLKKKDNWFFIQNYQWQLTQKDQKKRDYQESQILKENQMGRFKQYKKEEVTNNENDNDINKNDIKEEYLQKENKDVKAMNGIEKELYFNYSSPQFRDKYLQNYAIILAQVEVNSCSYQLKQNILKFEIYKLFSMVDIEFQVELEFELKNKQLLKQIHDTLLNNCKFSKKNPDYYNDYKKIYKKEQNLQNCMLKKQNSKTLKQCQSKFKSYCEYFEIYFGNDQDCRRYSVSKEMRMSLTFYDMLHDPLAFLTRRLKKRNLRIKNNKISK